jgi:hypothetical protein
MLVAAEMRNELSRAIKSKAIRSAIFEVGAWIGALAAAETAAELWPSLGFLPLIAAGGMCFYLSMSGREDWRSISYLQERLNRDQRHRDPAF